MNNNKKYPVSKNGHQCLGPCYYPNTDFVHPLYLTHINTRDKPHCPTVAYTTQDSNEKFVYDICLVPTHNKYSKEDLSLLTLSPHIEFNEDYFLKIYYNIYSLEDTINWINNNNFTPKTTRNRVFNLALKVYGKNIEIIDHRIVDYLKIFFVDNIDNIYKINKKYIGLENNSVKLVKSNKNKNQNVKVDIKKKYIINMFIKSDEIYKFITRYVKNRKNEWNNIDDHLLRLIDDFSKYIENKILLTLN
jgi:hypothetical protein